MLVISLMAGAEVILGFVVQSYRLFSIPDPSHPKLGMPTKIHPALFSLWNFILIRQVRVGKSGEGRASASPRDGPREKRVNSILFCFFFPKKSKTLEFSMPVVYSHNIVVERNSFMLKKKSYQRYTLIENILLEIKKSNE